MKPPNFPSPVAAIEEVEASKVCQAALKEVESELEGDRAQVEEMESDDPGETGAELMEFSGDEEVPPDTLYPDASPLDDVPAQLHREKRSQLPRKRSWKHP